MKKRVILIVLDSAGIGALPDAAEFGDLHTNTIGNIRRVRGKLDVENMYSLGLANIAGSTLPPYEGEIKGSYCRLGEKTKAKDTTSGHWEMAGLTLETPFRTYPNGFPPHIIDAYCEKIGRGVCRERRAEMTRFVGFKLAREERDERVKSLRKGGLCWGSVDTDRLGDVGHSGGDFGGEGGLV